MEGNPEPMGRAFLVRGGARQDKLPDNKVLVVSRTGDSEDSILDVNYPIMAPPLNQGPGGKKTGSRAVSFLKINKQRPHLKWSWELEERTLTHVTQPHH